jgi:glucokinase
MLTRHLATRVSVRNDAALAALGEHRHGAGRGVQNMVYVTISTGIGGGMIVDGRLVKGAGGYAGEIGELLVPATSGDPSMPVKLETVASGSAIATAAMRALDNDEESVLRNASADRMTSRMVAEAARGGDRMALRIMHTAARSIAFGIVDVIHLLNPERIVLGGGVMDSADIVMPVIGETVNRLAMKASLPPIVAGALGDDAGLFGAAAFLEETSS